MKKYLLIIFLFIGCSDNVPDNLISKEKMENIIFDIMILNAASGFDLKIDNIHNFVTSTYLNYPVEENFKMGNYTIVIEYFKKNFESFNN